MDERQRRALAVELSGPAFYVEVLRGQHVDDGHGLCVGCTTAGYGAPHVPWPCILRLLADEAHQIAVSRKFATPIAA